RANTKDQLTSLDHKDDIWLHARGVGGSHVVIRMGNQKDYPPKQVILQSAGYAAYYSKAKGMKTAPVMYTKRKYVRKPKGAQPGAVIVEREEVVMVPPVNPQNIGQELCSNLTEFIYADLWVPESQPSVGRWPKGWSSLFKIWMISSLKKRVKPFPVSLLI